MLSKIGLGLVVFILGFLGYVATREGHFKYERGDVINASAEKIFPYLVSFKNGNLWSPYYKKDPTMKIKITEPDAQVGTIFEFEGNSEVGSGKLEILKVVPNELVEMRLTMIKPFHGENLIEYTLTREEKGTRFNWTMTGDSGFMGKLISLFIDCDKMVGDDFSQGISNLKKMAEQKN